MKNELDSSLQIIRVYAKIKNHFRINSYQNLILSMSLKLLLLISFNNTKNFSSNLVYFNLILILIFITQYTNKY